MRSAEKKRTSSCLFADEIARISIHEYQKLCPVSLRESYQQTVLSTIILENIDSQDDHSRLQVISFGVGTKYMKYRYHNIQTKKLSKQYLFHIRDCHAEILARRGFLLFLYREIQSFYQYAINILKDNFETDISTIQTSIFQFDVPSTVLTKRDSEGVIKLSEYRIKFRDNIRFHLYTSSSPCGNACIKRWAKGKSIHHLDLDRTQYPNQPHPRLYLTAPQEGQAAVLTKKGSGSEIRYIDEEDNIHSERNEAIDFILSRLLRVDDYRYSAPSYPDSFIPPGTNHPPSYPFIGLTSIPGLSMTCSDKITLWNSVGIQGSLLSHLLAKPIYLSTITIGRKYSIPHVYRGLCCRAQDFQYPQSSALFACNHPVILCTAVKLDESIIMTSQDDELNESKRIGANFEDIRCICYSRCASFDHSNDYQEDTGTFEVINGETGMLLANDSECSSFCSMRLYENYLRCEELRSLFLEICQSKDLVSENSPSERVENDSISVSEYLLMKKVGLSTFQSLLEKSSKPNTHDSDVEENILNDGKSTLSSYCDAKHTLLTSQKSYLKGWIRTTTLLNSDS